MIDGDDSEIEERITVPGIKEEESAMVSKVLSSCNILVQCQLLR
jgi:hypothetical protein